MFSWNFSDDFTPQFSVNSWSFSIVSRKSEKSSGQILRVYLSSYLLSIDSSIFSKKLFPQVHICIEVCRSIIKCNANHSLHSSVYLLMRLFYNSWKLSCQILLIYLSSYLCIYRFIYLSSYLCVNMVPAPSALFGPNFPKLVLIHKVWLLAVRRDTQVR